MNRIFKFGVPVISFILVFVFIFQNSFAYSCPDYLFSKDLVKGSTDQDVAVIQEILNLDKRTKVAYTGPGSPGNETTFFGRATREALKRFQALFIEYVGIADGKFTIKTRTTMNAVCKGPFFTGQGKNVYDISTSTIATTSADTIPPIIAIAGPKVTDISTPFRAFLGANEAIQKPTLDGLIINGATAGDLRKLSSTTFSFLVTPNQDAKDQITLQFEADTISDLAGNTNDKASNEWDVAVTPATNTPDIVATDTPGTATDTTLQDLQNILNNLPSTSSSTATTTDCSNVTSVDVSDYSNPCYGKVPMTNNAAANSNQSQDQQQQNQTMQMLMGLLSGLLKGLTGGGGQGGSGSAQATCACAPGKINVLLTPKGGLGQTGFYDDTLNPGTGNYVGTPSMGPQYCGYKMVNGQCQGPTLNTLGQPVIGLVPTAPAFNWAGIGR